MMLMGVVIMPQEKLHVLFGLILMTQYFTTVTTSILLLSSSGKSSLSPSLSGSSSSPSKSLLLSASSNPSSVHLLWPLTSGIRGHEHEHQFHHHPKYSHSSSQSVPYYSSSSHHGESDSSRLSLIGGGGEVPNVMRTVRKHQKRHSGNDTRTSGAHSSGSHNDNNQGNQMVGRNYSVSTLQGSHSLSTSSSPSIPSLNESSTSVDTINSPSSQGSGDGANNRTVKSDSDRSDRGSISVPMCRHKVYYPQTVFELDTCAWCYHYIRDAEDSALFGKPSKKLTANITSVEDPDTGYTYIILGLIHNGTIILANVSDAESPIWLTFANEKAQKDWTGCCRAAKECCNRIVASWKPERDGTVELDTTTILPLEKDCPPTWDGWQCWNSTKPGIFAKSYCPNYIYFVMEPPTCAIPVEKKCTEVGRWATKPNGKEWTDYSSCALSTVQIQSNRSYVLVIAYAISIVALVPAVIIFFSFAQLRVPRIILHQNLFFSFILNGLMVIIFKSVVMMSGMNSVNSIVSQNSIGCRLLLISTKYLRMTNYMWMLCEGFYLHKLIAAAFAEQRSLLVFYLIGWVFPIFPTAFYAGYRMLAANSNNQCWVTPSGEWEWVLNGPSLLSLLINALFLINIIRVLVTKLRAAHAQEPSQYRKAVRATLVLLPLFGLHFVVTIYRPNTSQGVCQGWTEFYFYANDVLDGIQGFLVALIFCYCNGEVISLLKRAYTRWKEDHFNVGQRRNSRHRPSRGSVLGRSVVSTHIYSSIPPSPETNVIALPCGSNSNSMDPSPSSLGGNLLTVNGASGAVTISSNENNTATTDTLPSAMKKSDSKSSLKNRKNHTSTATNGNAINMYVSSEYGSVKENPGVEFSSV